MDHESLAKQDKKHVGVSNYNQVTKVSHPYKIGLFQI